MRHSGNLRIAFIFRCDGWELTLPCDYFLRKVSMEIFNVSKNALTISKDDTQAWQKAKNELQNKLSMAT